MLNSVVFDSSNNKIVIAYYQSDHAEVVLGTVSGTSISFATHADTGTGDRNSAAYDTTNNKVVIAGRKDALAKVVVRSPAISLTSENYIGIANAAYADGQKATIKTTGSIARNVAPTAVAVPTPTNRTIIEEVSSNYLFRSTTISLGSGKFVILYTIYLGSGEPVVYYKVGTIDQATNTVSYSDRTSTNAFTAYSLSGILDTNANRIVVVYENGADGKGYAAVGTVSGNTISFGTPVVFEDDVVKRDKSYF